MTFKDRLEKSIEDNSKTWEPRPEILLLPQIPKPLHGMAPRVVLGDKWWNETRKAAYKSTDFHCISCGVHKSKAKGPKWLEGHEVYDTDYKKGRMVYIETVPLCHFCHNYIHQGRLESLLDQNKITHGRYSAIITHGESILARVGLVRPLPYEGPFANWETWRLVVNGKEYEPKFKSIQEWAAHFGHELEE